jgi:hypothetical protein
MCDSCSHTCKGLTVPHTPLECPWRRSLQCHRCFSTGHAPSTCPLRLAEPPILEVLATDTGIRTFLLTQGLKPPSTRDKNLQLLKDIANTHSPPKLLVLKY